MIFLDFLNQPWMLVLLLVVMQLLRPRKREKSISWGDLTRTKDVLVLAVPSRHVYASARQIYDRYVSWISRKSPRSWGARWAWAWKLTIRNFGLRAFLARPSSCSHSTISRFVSLELHSLYVLWKNWFSRQRGEKKVDSPTFTLAECSKVSNRYAFHGWPLWR